MPAYLRALRQKKSDRKIREWAAFKTHYVTQVLAEYKAPQVSFNYS